VDHRKSDLKELLDRQERTLADARLAIQASEELLDRVKRVSQSVDARIQQVLAGQHETPESDSSDASAGN
jgi:hypothetical protein